MREGFKIVYADEVMTTVSTIQRKEWSHKADYLVVDRNQYHKMTLATIGAISAEKGVELAMTFDHSVNVQKFHEFLVTLRNLNKRRRLAVFLDRLNVHRSPKIVKLAKTIGVELVFNAAYSPDYNPIERVFSLVKRSIKKQRLNAIMNERPLDDRVIIEKAFDEIKQSTVSNYVANSLK